MLPACFRGLISVLNEQAARSTGLIEKLVFLTEIGHPTPCFFCENWDGSFSREIMVTLF